MIRRSHIRRRWPCALPLLVMLLAGCQFDWFGLRRGGDEDAALLRQQFQEQLVLSTEAVNDADLDRARAHLEQARANAASERDRRKVENLGRLVDGAAALLEGDPDRARAEWSAIDDQHLHRELRRKARLIGMDLPREPRRDDG